MGRAFSSAQQAHCSTIHFIRWQNQGQITREKTFIYKDWQLKGLAPQSRTLQHLSVVGVIVMAKGEFQILVVCHFRKQALEQNFLPKYILIPTAMLLQYVPSGYEIHMM